MICTMAYDLHLVFDCADVDLVSRFWLTALEGYTYPGSPPDAPGAPPAGFATWEEWADAQGIPADQRYLARTIIDPTGKRPDIFFNQVPEPKTVKNRVHLDIAVSRSVPPEEREARVEAEVERLITAGATLVSRSHLSVLRDPEGNEFCVG
jgi:hypothetical protein